MLWFTYCYPTVHDWSSYYTSRMQVFTQIMSIRGILKKLQKTNLGNTKNYLLLQRNATEKLQRYRDPNDHQDDYRRSKKYTCHRSRLTLHSTLSSKEEKQIGKFIQTLKIFFYHS